jgi:hypothetical protein
MNNHIPVIIKLKGAVKNLSGKVGKKQRAAYPDKAKAESKTNNL